MRKFELFIIFLAIFFWCFVGTANAYLVENLNLANSGSIIVGPGKTELLLSPGDTYNMNVTAANASGMTKIIKFTTEDIGASNDPNVPLEFLGNQAGPYSLKDFIKPEANQITLLTGQRVTMPITITIPKDTAPGGLYGGVMVAAENLPTTTVTPAGQATGQINIITRVAVLFFIRVKGDVLESSYLKDFTTDKNFYEQGPVSFKITSENTGNVYLSPYGAIEVKDIFGRSIDQRDIDPWFVLPKVDRTREIKWNSNFLFGKYTALLTLHRGYMNAKDVADTKSIDFWIIPWKIITVALIILILVIWLLVWIFSHIQWKKERPTVSPTPKSVPPPIQNSPPPSPSPPPIPPYNASNIKT